MRTKLSPVDSLVILLRQGANFVAELQEFLLPAPGFRRRVLIEAFRVRHALRAGLDHLAHQLGNFRVAAEVGKQVADHGHIRGDTCQVHETEKAGKRDPIPIVIAARTIHVCRCRAPVFDQVEGFPQHGVKDPVAYEAPHVAPHEGGLLLPVPRQPDDALRALGVGLISADDFHKQVDVSGFPQ